MELNKNKATGNVPAKNPRDMIAGDIFVSNILNGVDALNLVDKTPLYKKSYLDDKTNYLWTTASTFSVYPSLSNIYEKISSN